MRVSERIFAASANEGELPSQLAEELARRIEDDIASLGLPPGSTLGSLRVLAERYRLGRSVVREAVGLLERRGLGKMRPGPCGGFILEKPHPERVAAELAAHFRASGVTLRQVLDAREAVDLMVMRLAARAAPQEQTLTALDASLAAGGLVGSLSARLELARLTDQPILQLLIDCLNRLTSDFAAPVSAAAVRARLTGALPAVRDAVLRGREEALAAAANRAHRELIGWLAERPGPRAGSPDGLFPGAAESLPVAIARQLAAQIGQTGRSGARLGSEWDLGERFGVSRLTLRQAIRLLQDSGLVECRRGRGNGLVVRDRRATGCIRLMLGYLISERADPIEAGAILLRLNCFVPALAVARASAAERERLRAALATLTRCDSIERFELLRLVQSVSRLADSPIIDLFSRAFAAYEARFRAPLAERLSASAHASYFDLLQRLLERTGAGSEAELDAAKRESAALLYEMSLSRPI